MANQYHNAIINSHLIKNRNKFLPEHRYIIEKFIEIPKVKNLSDLVRTVRIGDVVDVNFYWDDSEEFFRNMPMVYEGRIDGKYAFMGEDGGVHRRIKSWRWTKEDLEFDEIGEITMSIHSLLIVYHPKTERYRTKKAMMVLAGLID